MEARSFDRLTKIVGQSTSRRTGVRAALAAFLILDSRDALAKLHAVSKTRRSRLRAEACIPTGKQCPSKKPRGKKGKKLSCNRCCQGHTAVVNGVTTCACQPDTMPCTTSTECCAGVCTNGSCVANPSPPPPPCDGPALGETCTEGGTPCCTNVNPNAQCASGFNEINFTCQDCTQPPTAAGALCQTPNGNQCCGGNPHCFVGIQVSDGQPACFVSGQCTRDSACTGATGCDAGEVCAQAPSGCNCSTGTFCGVLCGGAG